MAPTEGRVAKLNGGGTAAVVPRYDTCKVMSLLSVTSTATHGNKFSD